MTFAVLRALHQIIGEALDDIQRTYNPELPQSNTGGSSSGPGSVHSDQAHSDRSGHGPYASPPPSPSTAAHPTLPLDFPSLDAPYDPSDPAEQLTTDPTVLVAINRIVAAAGQLAATVQLPFLSICDASMAYHLPSCMRLLEASHTVEILREAGPSGLHVDEISARNGVERARLAHILRFLATHHILRECRPNVFAINRISSLLDSGKSLAQIRISEKESRPELKYHGSDGIAAFVGLSTDELFKASAYMTEAYLLSRSRSPRAPFQYAFATNSPYFAWLEGEKVFSSSDSKSTHRSSASDGVETGPGSIYPAVQGPDSRLCTDISLESAGGWKHQDSSDYGITNPNQFRLERFGKAMSGTGSWETPGAILNGFDWAALPKGSVIVDVGGGIGSTSMLLASAFSRAGHCEANDTEAADLGFRFIIQDRPIVVKMGQKAWRANCPEFLDSGVARFQVHDFFTSQPIRKAAVFLLRVIMHDWPDAQARKILLRLREAATEDTKLLLADFVLPLACVDDAGGAGGVLEGIEGADTMLASAPLLANLGKASTHVYCMDLTMQATFNSKERTLHEIVSIASSAGWKVVKVSHAVGSLFSYIVAIPAPMPTERRTRSDSSSAHASGGRSASPAPSGKRLPEKSGIDLIERASSRCGTPTFGSQTELPSIRDAIKRFGGGSLRARGIGLFSREGAKRPLPQQPPALQKSGMLKQPIVLSSPVKKKRPSPLSLQPPLPVVSTSSSPSSAMLASPRPSVPSSPIRRRMSLAQLSSRSQSQEGSNPSSPGPRQTIFSQPPASPMSPRPPHVPTLSRRTSYAHITAQGGTGHTSLDASSVSPAGPAVPALPLPPVPTTPSAPGKQYRSPSPHPRLARRMSHAQLGSVSARGASIFGAASLAPSSIPMRQPPPPVPQDHLRQLQRPFPPLPQTPSQSNEGASAHAYHNSLTMSSRPSHGTTPISGVPIIANSPVASRNPPLPRRSSFAQLRQTSLRTRTGSIAGLSALTLREGGPGGPGSGRGARPEPFLPRSGSYSGDGKRAETPEKSTPVLQGSVLAAAARIEHGSGRVQHSS